MRVANGILVKHQLSGKRRLMYLAASLLGLALFAATAGSASASPTSPNILITEAQCDPANPATTLRGQLLAQPGVAAVDFFDGSVATPSAAQLRAYDLVIAMADCGWFDAVAMGNSLADYQDQGGVVVGTSFDWEGPGSYTLEGRWIDAGYSPYQTDAGGSFSDSSLGAHDASSPLLAGVSLLTAFYRNDLVLNPGATEVAKWADGRSAVAFKGSAVGINAHLGENYDPIGWGGDFAKIIVNAAPRPSNAFSVTLKGQKLRVQVSAPGTAVVADKGTPLRASAAKKKRRLLLRSSTASGGPPTITIPLRLTKIAKQQLLRTGKAKVKARITFTPTRGVAKTQTAKLRLRRKR